MFAWIERFALYLIILLLLAVVGLLVLKTNGTDSSDGCIGCETTVAKAIEDSLAGLEGRVADAVSANLLAEGCRVTKPDTECVRTTPPPSIEMMSRFTLLYENARLDEGERLTRNSFGVKLAHHHLKRLELITDAFGPCHAEGNPVVLRVTGSSSTAEFRIRPSGEPMDKSAALNLKTANLRAEIVEDYLVRQGFDVRSAKWDDIDHLHRRYLDNAQALDRTVLIEVESAGACSTK